MKGIVITTSKYTKDFLEPLLKSIANAPYQILIVSNDGYQPLGVGSTEPMKTGIVHNLIDLFRNVPYETKLLINPINGWEIAGIKAGQENFDEFVHIMDTTIIKDISLFDKAFAIDGHVVFTKGNFHYMGKFVSKDLPNLPIVRDKVTAIMMETTWLNGFPFTEFEPDLPVHSLVWEDKFGQNRMRIENEFMIKWKGTVWISPEQLAELTEQEKEKFNKEKSK